MSTILNLLPADVKHSYQFARYNTVLRRWLWAIWAGIGGLVAITLAGMFYLHQTTHNLNQDIKANETSLANQHIDEVRKQTTDISNNLKLVVQVLSGEVLFSELLQHVGSITPSNVVLTGLSISKVQGAVDLTAASTDYNAATQFQVNLQDPKNQVFSKADIVSITCNASDPRYPCTVDIRALFSANNPFLFINHSQKAGA